MLMFRALALCHSKSVDCWLCECGLYNYRMYELCFCRIVENKNDTLSKNRFLIFWD